MDTLINLSYRSAMFPVHTVMTWTKETKPAAVFLLPETPPQNARSSSVFPDFTPQTAPPSTTVPPHSCSLWYASYYKGFLPSFTRSCLAQFEISKILTRQISLEPGEDVRTWFEAHEYDAHGHSLGASYVDGAGDVHVPAWKHRTQKDHWK